MCVGGGILGHTSGHEFKPRAFFWCCFPPFPILMLFFSGCSYSPKVRVFSTLSKVSGTKYSVSPWLSSGSSVSPRLAFRQGHQSHLDWEPSVFTWLFVQQGLKLCPAAGPVSLTLFYIDLLTILKDNLSLIFEMAKNVM